MLKGLSLSSWRPEMGTFTKPLCWTRQSIPQRLLTGLCKSALVASEWPCSNFKAKKASKVLIEPFVLHYRHLRPKWKELIYCGWNTSYWCICFCFNFSLVFFGGVMHIDKKLPWFTSKVKGFDLLWMKYILQVYGNITWK